MIDSALVVEPNAISFATAQGKRPLPITTAATTMTAISSDMSPTFASSPLISPISPSLSMSQASLRHISPDTLCSDDAASSTSTCDEPEMALEASESDLVNGDALFAGILHKKDSGASMGSTTSIMESSNGEDSSPPPPPPANEISDNKSHDYHYQQALLGSVRARPGTARAGATGARISRRLSQPTATSNNTAPIAATLSKATTPTGRVLTRTLSTSRVSSTSTSNATAAPHILPSHPQRSAGFNLATLGQLSPTASTSTMTMSRSETLAFLNSNNHNSYFTVGPHGSSRVSYHGETNGFPGGNGVGSGGGAGSGAGTGPGTGPGTGGTQLEGIVLPSGTSKVMPMCGSDAISLLDLEDSHNDLVMIDSNGNSSGNGVAGAAVVGETIASASAIVSNIRPASGTLTASTTSAFFRAAAGGSGGTVVAGGSAVHGSGGAGGLHGEDQGEHFGNNEGVGGSGGVGVTVSGAHHPSNASSVPTLTSQARKDAMQRAAMLAAIQQNGGAKILASQRVGRWRHDLPSRKIRFGEFHRICEIEYGFEDGKLYLFSDVLVTGTKIRNHFTTSVKATEAKSPSPASEASGEQFTLSSETDGSPRGLPPEAQKDELEVDYLDSKDTPVKNPYAGHLENQHISRLIQVQADVVEDDERPLLKITAPQMSSVLLFDSITTRDNFLALLNETTVAHKHHLLFQSKYLADLKKFKRHSAFSFDTSFLKTWGIPGGLNLGSIKPIGGSNNSSGGAHHTNGTIGPGTFAPTSPVTSPGGGAFEPYQYQQFLNRPQSMAGSLFSFALNNSPFSSFGDHSKENSYATLRGANAASALQYHHQQQQMLHQQLQNRLSMSSTMTASGLGRPMSDRTSSGSALETLWFIKGNSGNVGGHDHGKSTIRRSAVEVVSALVAGDPEREKAGEKEKASAETVIGSGTSGTSLRSSSSASSLATLASSSNSTSAANPSSSGNSDNIHVESNQNPPRYSSSTYSFSILPSSGSSGSNYNTSTLRNGAGWVRDEDAAVCMVCMTTKFGVLVRKHHCRLCGRVICWKCCQMKDVVLMPEAGSTQPIVPHELRKPIRVCLDCIEEDAAVEQQQKQHQHQPLQQQKSQPHSPQSPTFPLQGMFGKLMGSTSGNTQHATSAMNATGSVPTMPLPPQQPFFPRSGRTGHPYPHHHRASLYRIDVECVGEEDEEEEEEEEEEDEEEEVEEVEDTTNNEGDGVHGHVKDPTSDGASPEERQTSSARQSIKSRRSSRIIHSNHGTIRLKDLDPADINEDEINNQIRTLESEVKNILIQNAPLMFVGAEDSDTKVSRHRRHDYMDIDSSTAGKTRVIRGIPKEFLQGTGGFCAEDVREGREENEEEEEEEGEEKTMEELLAEQDEHVTRMLAR
ncbi:hypothetical protein BGX34_007715 [Mortierella sp. NVP85]|nr:hypothetical protein BGX34_007715 [Mortierella sp. NVP85]